jgi:hypothetical protein
MVKAANGGPQVATANRLRDGAVVFLAAGGAWTTDLQAARVAAGADEAHGLTQAADEAVRQALVVGPYLIAVSNESGRWIPQSYRERIRAEGPSLALPRAAAPAGE